jgi:hypothetical protein
MMSEFLIKLSAFWLFCIIAIYAIYWLSGVRRGDR